MIVKDVTVDWTNLGTAFPQKLELHRAGFTPGEWLLMIAIALILVFLFRKRNTLRADALCAALALFCWSGAEQWQLKVYASTAGRTTLPEIYFSQQACEKAGELWEEYIHAETPDEDVETLLTDHQCEPINVVFPPRKGIVT